MAYSIKRHEVDRVMNVLTALGWTLEQEIFETDSIRLEIKKTLSKELLLAAGELDFPSSPQ